MSAFFSPFLAASIIADIPPPSHFHPHHLLESWTWLLIYLAISAIAIVGVRTLFWRRPKNSAPKPEEAIKK